MIRYYSTNRRLDGLPGLAPFKGRVSFREALIQGQAPDEGLFMPEPIPRLSIDDILALKGAPYAKAALLVAHAFLGEELSRDVLRQIVEDSYNFDVPWSGSVTECTSCVSTRGPRLLSRILQPG